MIDKSRLARELKNDDQPEPPNEGEHKMLSQNQEDPADLESKDEKVPWLFSFYCSCAVPIFICC